MSDSYIFASSKEWCLDEYNTTLGKDPNWYLVTSKQELTIEFVEKIDPKYIFFPHWNWLVPNKMTKNYNCVCFHMADVPYGRGGSPLQNLIVRGHETTKLTALKMVRELDAGPVYSKADLSLAGSAEEIFKRTAPKVISLIMEIINNKIVPKEQTGKVITFNRRTPDQSEILGTMSINEIYDLIRMLDADNYPRAFIDVGQYRIEFSNVNKKENSDLSASVSIINRKEG